MRKSVFVIILLVLLSYFFPVIELFNFSPETLKRYTEISNIIINSDNDFLKYNFPGSGAKTDPYVIENYTITGPNGVISVSNTHKYFVIRNCLISGSSDFGIIISDIADGTAIIENNTISSCGLSGIRFGENSRVQGQIITGNLLINNVEGISIYTNDNNIITNNFLINNEKWGVGLVWGGINNTITNNYFFSNYNELDFTQATDEGSGNDWNGNYWNNWNGFKPYPIGGSGEAYDYSPLVCDDNDTDNLVNEIENALHCDINNPDTDGDGVFDGEEVESGTDPLDPSSFPASSDNSEPTSSDNSEPTSSDNSEPTTTISIPLGTTTGFIIVFVSLISLSLLSYRVLFRRIK